MKKSRIEDNNGVSLEVIKESGPVPGVVMEVSKGNRRLFPRLTTHEDVGFVISCLREAGECVGILPHPDGIWAEIRDVFSSRFPLKAAFLLEIRLVWHSGNRVILELPQGDHVLPNVIRRPVFLGALAAVADEFLGQSDLIFIPPASEPLFSARELISATIAQ